MRYVALILTCAVFIMMAGCGTQPRADVISLYINKSTNKLYIVKPNDTLSSIAKTHNIDYHELARINKISPPFSVYAGQRLVLRGANNNLIALNGNKNAGVPVTNSGTIVSNHAKASKFNGVILQDRSLNSTKMVTPVTRPSAITSVNESKVTSKPIMTRPVPAPIAAAIEKPTQAEIAGKQLKWIWPTKGPILSRFLKGEAKKNGINIGGSEGAPIIAVASGKVVYSGNGLRGYGNLIILKHNNDFLSAYAHNRENLVKEGDNITSGQQIAAMGKTGTDKVMLHFEIRYNGAPINPENILPKR